MSVCVLLGSGGGTSWGGIFERLRARAHQPLLPSACVLAPPGSVQDEEQTLLLESGNSYQVGQRTALLARV